MKLEVKISTKLIETYHIEIDLDPKTKYTQEDLNGRALQVLFSHMRNGELKPVETAPSKNWQFESSKVLDEQ